MWPLSTREDQEKYRRDMGALCSKKNSSGYKKVIFQHIFTLKAYAT